MNLRFAASLAAATLLLAGCVSKPTIGFEANQQAPFSEFKTYALLPLPNKVEGGDPGAALRIAPLVTSEIKSGMAQKGYREVPAEQADVVLHVRGKIVGKTDVTDWGYSYAGYGRWGGYYDPMGGVSVDQYNEGVLSIEAFHRPSKQIVWVGWAQARLEEKVNEARLKEALVNIVSQFPQAGTAPAPKPAKK
jgi:hypothetical protein